MRSTRPVGTVTVPTTTTPAAGRRRRRAVGAAAFLAVLLAPATAATAVPADPPVTVCSGVLDRPVPGDVRVPRHCQVMGVPVGGDLLVAAGAYGAVEGGSVAGDVRVGRGGTAVLAFADVGGGVHLDGAERLTADGSIARSVRGRVRTVQITGRVGGAVNVAMPYAESATGLWLYGADVGGWVNVYGGRNSVQHSVLRRGLTLSWTRQTAVCSTSVVADVTVRHARRAVQLGDRTLRIGQHEWDDGLGCGTGDSRNRFGAALRLVDNDGTPYVDHTDVLGDLECRANARPPVLRAGLEVAGERLGDC